MATTKSLTLHRTRGRPRKFAAPSRSVTLTLPEATLKSLETIDLDISHAIIRLAGRVRPAPLERRAAELTRFGRRAVITVRPTAALETRAGLELVPLPDGRALIAFEQPKTVADLELTINDALDDHTLASDARKVFEEVRAILKAARQSSDVTLMRHSIIVLEAVSGAPVASRDNGRSRGRA